MSLRSQRALRWALKGVRLAVVGALLGGATLASAQVPPVEDETAAATTIEDPAPESEPNEGAADATAAPVTNPGPAEGDPAPAAEGDPAPADGAAEADGAVDPPAAMVDPTIPKAVSDMLHCKRPGDESASKIPEEESLEDAARSLEMQGERGEHAAAVARFSTAAEDFHSEVNRLLTGAIDRRKSFLEKGYKRDIDDLEVGERDRRDAAIARFERFIGKYPNENDYTPDAMFRLAELYFERTEVDYEDALVQFDLDQNLYDRGKIPSEPESPERNFGPSKRLYNTLIKRFGGTYRYADAVYYLLGYVEAAAGEEREARTTWRALVANFPQSSYAPEIYLRIGEMYFDYGEFEEASKEYLAALNFPESRFYDKALYKLAWTYFQLWNYDKAILAFRDLIAWYAEDGRDAAGSALREEAIQYLARSLTEDDWDNDGLDDEGSGVPRALSYLSEGADFELEILEEYADSLFNLHDDKKYHESVAVYKIILERKPLAFKALNHQRQIVKIYDILRDVDAASDAREDLAAMFDPKDAWARANADNPEYLRMKDTAVAQSMRERAQWRHQKAQDLVGQAQDEGDEQFLVAAVAEYGKAAAAYGDYLKEFPNETDSYEISYHYAETLYFSNQFERAAAAYGAVARNPNNIQYKEPSAWGMLQSFERLLVTEAAAGRIDPKAVPGSDWQPPPLASGSDATGTQKVVAEPLPRLLKGWLTAAEYYTTHEFRRDGVGDDSTLAYQIAEMYYRYRDFAMAREGFEQVIACFPRTEVAGLAAGNIIDSYREEGDFANLEKWADLTEKLQIGDPELTKSIRAKIKVFKLGAQFDNADRLFAEKKYLAAAREFERLAEQNPDATFADKAFFNAASAYKEVKYYDSASRIFEKLVSDRRFKKSEFAEESLRELAEAHTLFFNFERAVTAFMSLYERFPNGENRAYALFMVARQQESLGQKRVAAKTYERYVTEFPSRDDASVALFRAGELYQELGDIKEQGRVWKTFIAKFAGRIGMDTKVIQAMLEQARLAKARNSMKTALRLYGDVMREYQARGLQPGTLAAVAAAEAHFEVVEETLRSYEGIRLKGTQKRMTADLGRKNKLLGDLEELYTPILAYKAVDWTIAASYRLGYVYDEFAKTLYAAPEPKGLNMDELDIFITMIEDEGLKYENVAITRYETTVAQVLKLKVTNSWAKAALKAINKYKPGQYPLFKEEKRALVFEDLFTGQAPMVEVVR